MSDTIKTVRVTKAQKFDAISKVLHAMEDGTDYEPVHIKGTDKAAGVVLDIPTLLTFINAEQELLAKKNTGKDGEKKLTSVQQDNIVYMDKIVEFLPPYQEDEDGNVIGMTCTQVQKGVPELNDFSTNKVSALLRSLITANRVKKSAVKGRSIFTLA